VQRCQQQREQQRADEAEREPGVEDCGVDGLQRLDERAALSNTSSATGKPVAAESALLGTSTLGQPITDAKESVT
jgi:hypothetical protein